MSNGAESSTYSAAADNALSRAIKRDLRRAALFLWMIPFPATRSSTAIASRTVSAAIVWSPSSIVNRAFFTYVFAAERYGWLRARLRSATRIRFSADLLLANVTQSLRLNAHHARKRVDASKLPGTSYHAPRAGSTAYALRTVTGRPCAPTQIVTLWPVMVKRIATGDGPR